MSPRPDFKELETFLTEEPPPKPSTSLGGMLLSFILGISAGLAVLTALVILVTSEW